MNLNRKSEIARRAVESISLHFDESVETVHAVLDHLAEFVQTEKAAFAARKTAHEAAQAARSAAKPKE